MSPRWTELVAALSEPGAPTALHDGRAHIDDALTGLDAVGRPGSIADLGSGNGIPGLVLASCLPGARVYCVEAARKRADWIAATAARCGIENAEAVWTRAEEWEGVVDVVVARALAALPVLCEYAAPLLGVGGVLVAWKGAAEPDEAADGDHASAELGLSSARVVAVKPFTASRQRHLYVYSKLTATPPKYPRRSGQASKKPLIRSG